LQIKNPIPVFEGVRMVDLENEIGRLQIKIFDLERDLFQYQHFGNIAEEKLKVWVAKHDELLIKYKELQKNYDKCQKNQSQKNDEEGSGSETDAEAKN
jgi:hypothetical protein